MTNIRVRLPGPVHQDIGAKKNAQRNRAEIERGFRNTALCLETITRRLNELEARVDDCCGVPSVVPTQDQFNTYMRNLAPDYWIRLDDAEGAGVKNYGEGEGVNKDTGVDRLSIDHNGSSARYQDPGYFPGGFAMFQTPSGGSNDAGFTMTVSPTAGTPNEFLRTHFVMIKPNYVGNPGFLSFMQTGRRASAPSASQQCLYAGLRNVNNSGGHDWRWVVEERIESTGTWFQKEVSIPTMEIDGTEWFAVVVRHGDINNHPYDIWVNKQRIGVWSDSNGTGLTENSAFYLGTTSDINAAWAFRGTYQHMCIWDGRHLTDEEIEDLFDFIGLTDGVS